MVTWEKGFKLKSVVQIGDIVDGEFKSKYDSPNSNGLLCWKPGDEIDLTQPVAGLRINKQYRDDIYVVHGLVDDTFDSGKLFYQIIKQEI
ncbi:hypothetical protein HN385_00280 [archaeon]|jgi:hypothetical protein|nr:hypothetical protein [archaeon]MBT3451640.1 hypothetical protein [archaeon]MBT6869661.1 hypothetical protein [archaeon]MBT7192429.1 hypothetical protein [archaeon]MBT7380230.1 hypothetical protein [archaeon]